MCIDTDLFGDVIVKVCEVELWLDVTANMQGRAQSQREHYAKIYDVANKIKLSKIDGSFYKLMDKLDNNQPKSLQLYATVYKSALSDLKKPACPDWFHTCYEVNCPVFQKRIASEKYKKRWRQRKS